jgi:hypothetical protein
LKRVQRRRDISSQCTHLRSVVLVGDRARAVVELEIAERREGAIACLEQIQPASLPVVELLEYVRLGLWLAKEWKGDGDHAGDGKRCSEQ